MDKRIESELNDRSPSEVTELNLDGTKFEKISGLTEEFSSLRALSISKAGLTSLKEFPKLEKLAKLYVNCASLTQRRCTVHQQLNLSNNKLAGGLQHLFGCTNLTRLNLSKNDISEFEQLDPLKEQAALRSLELIDCPIIEDDDYRSKVFDLLPQLKFLDGFDAKEEEEEEDSDDDDALVGEDDGQEDDEDDEEGEVAKKAAGEEEEENGHAGEEDEEEGEGGAESKRGTKRKHDGPDEEEEEGEEDEESD